MLHCCPICLEQVCDPEDPNVFDAECGHQARFHAECLSLWVSGDGSKTCAVCPICRGPMRVRSNESSVDSEGDTEERTTSIADSVRRLGVIRAQAGATMHLLFLFALHVIAVFFRYYESCVDIACIATLLSFCQAAMALSAFSWPSRPDSCMPSKIMALTVACFVTRILHLTCSAPGLVSVGVDILSCSLAGSLTAMYCRSMHRVDDS